MAKPLARIAAVQFGFALGIGAIVARAAQLRKATLPGNEEERRLARVEGWIRLPRCSLGELVAA